MTKGKKIIFLLITILLISLFLRSYQIIERFEFAHDGDLYSWVVKDIVLNKHLRLFGQQTTTTGVYIGPHFYYMLVPFFILTGMDPVGALIPITILGVLTTFSYFYVFSKLYNPTIGLIAAFLQAVLIGSIHFDRSVVPTTPTALWSVWYLYCLVMIVRKKFFVLPILGVLIGVIWSIHLALLPALLGLIPAFVLARKIPRKKETLFFILTLLITSLPLLVFELRHTFVQTLTVIKSFGADLGGSTGPYKLYMISKMLVKNLEFLIFAPQDIKIFDKIYLLILILVSPLMVKIQSFSRREMLPLYIWILGVVYYFTFSSIPISEYYFSNIEVIYIMVISLLLASLYRYSKLYKVVVVLLLLIIGLKNTYYIINEPVYSKGYVEKKALVEYLLKDSKQKGYPCIAISYLTNKGEDVGYRYLFWLNNMHVNKPNSGAPIYTIVYPYELSIDSVRQKFGHIGLIPPERVPTPEQISKSCSGQNSNLTDPLLNYTN